MSPVHRHEGKLREAVEQYCHIPVVGSIPKDPDLRIAERHLGLIPSGESGESEHSLSASAGSWNLILIWIRFWRLRADLQDNPLLPALSQSGEGGEAPRPPSRKATGKQDRCDPGPRLQFLLSRKSRSIELGRALNSSLSIRCGIDCPKLMGSISEAASLNSS